MGFGRRTIVVFQFTRYKDGEDGEEDDKFKSLAWNFQAEVIVVLEVHSLSLSVWEIEEEEELTHMNMRLKVIVLLCSHVVMIRGGPPTIVSFCFCDGDMYYHMVPRAAFEILWMCS